MQIRALSITTLLMISVLLPGSPFTKANGQQPVVVCAFLTPKENIWVGQRVTLEVDVLIRSDWAQIKQIRDFEISGALVQRVETQGTRIQETLDGESYSDKRYELLVFPKRSGKIQVPAVPVEVEIKSWGANAKSSVERVNTPALQFQANLPPGAQQESELISTTELKARQQWEPETGEVKVGDSLKHVLAFEAADVPGSAFVPLAYDPVDGVAVYPIQPLVSDRTDRGTLTGSRKESVTYVFQEPGKAKIPDVTVTWWDITNEELKRETLQGRTLAVVLNPAAQTSAASQAQKDRSATGKWWWSIPILAFLAALAWTFRHRLQSRWRYWRQERQESEVAFFRQCLKTARSNDAKATFNALMRWLDHMHQGRESPRLDIFLDQYGDNTARQGAAALIHAATSVERLRWNGGGGSKALKKARSRWLNAEQNQGAARSVLPALNPTPGLLPKSEN
jgi:hypothetical protein